MKTEKQILDEWMTKDTLGLRYTQEDRIISAMREFAEQSRQADVSGALQNAAKELADEAWRMLPDSCKEIMKNLEITYKGSLAADIEDMFGGNDR